MENDSAYVSLADFRKLEQKVNHIIQVHALDEELTKEEKDLIDEARKDIRKNKSEFVSVDSL